MRATMALCVVLITALAQTGCASRSGDLTFGPGRLTALELQVRNRAIADTFATHAGETWDRVIRETTDPAVATRAAFERLSTVSAAWSIASGRCDPSAAVEMVTLFSLLRRVYERPWTAEIFGAEESSSIVAQARLFEQRAWETAELALTPAQRDELTSLIEEWVASHPEQTSVALVRFGDLAGVRRGAGSRDAGPGSLFSLFMLDPLYRLDPATHELEQSRQVAERMLYAAERWPFQIRWQLELLGLRASGRDEVRRMLAAVETTSAAAAVLPAAVGEEGQRLVDRATDRLAAEREAAIAQLGDELERRSEVLLVGLDERRDELTDLMREARATLEAGDRLAVNLNAATVQMQNLIAPRPRSPDAPPSGATLAEVRDLVDGASTGVARVGEVTGDLRSIIESPGWTDRTSEVATIVADVDRRMNALVDRAFMRLALLVLFAAVAIGVAVAVARRVSP